MTTSLSVLSASLNMSSVSDHDHSSRMWDHYANDLSEDVPHQTVMEGRHALVAALQHGY